MELKLIFGRKEKDLYKLELNLGVGAKFDFVIELFCISPEPKFWAYAKSHYK